MKTETHNNKLPKHSVSFLFEDKLVSWVEKLDTDEYKKETFSIKEGYASFRMDKVYQKLKEDKFLESDYSFIDVSILNNQFSLIPLEYFEEDLAETFLNYTIPYTKNKGIRFNLIPQFDLVLVFYYPEEIEDVFSRLSEKVRITHTGFKFLSKIKNDFRKNGVFLNTYSTNFELAVIENEKLLLYNVYPYATVEDIIYFLQAIFKNIGISLLSTQLYYFGTLEDKDGFLDQLIPYFGNAIRGVEEDKFERVNFTILDLI